MESVCGATGMFYRCFQDKEEILNVLVEKWAALYAQKITILLSDPQSAFCEKFISILSVIREMSSQTIGMDSFFTASNEIMLIKLIKQMSCIFVPLLSSVLDSGIKMEGKHIKATHQDIACPCKRKKCERYGNCAACKEHHHNSARKSMTACERFEAKKERKNRRT